MKHVSLSGNWNGCFSLLKSFLDLGYVVSILPEQEITPISCDLTIARIENTKDMESLSKLDTPWLAWCVSDENTLANQAYMKGALAVFSVETPEEIVVKATQRNLERLTIGSKTVGNVIQRRYKRGDVILLEQDTVLEIQQGVIAQIMVHQDGTEVLLGLCGPNQLVIPHPADTCYIQLTSHSDSTVAIKSWGLASQDLGFPEKLRSRLQQMEAWAAMQARTHLDQRVIGILSLLAEQFGVTTPEGVLVDVRITHTQLASAVGATRTTITRTIGDLRNQDKLFLVQTSDGERYCLPQWEHSRHGVQSAGC